MLLFHCILTLMYDLFQRENLVFKPTSLLVLLHCRVGKDWAGPIFPPFQNVPVFIFIFSVFWIMQLFECICTLLNDLFQSENNVFVLISLMVLLLCGVGKNWVGQFSPPPPPKWLDLSNYCLVFGFMLLFDCI